MPTLGCSLDFRLLHRSSTQPGWQDQSKQQRNMSRGDAASRRDVIHAALNLVPYKDGVTICAWVSQIPQPPSDDSIIKDQTPIRHRPITSTKLRRCRLSARRQQILGQNFFQKPLLTPHTPGMGTQSVSPTSLDWAPASSHSSA